MKLVVGLGNPGPKYDGTRHNIGFAVVDRLATRWGIGLGAEKFHGWFGLGEVKGVRAALLKPITFMNRSGRSVSAVVRFYQLGPDDLLVISDDAALPLGRIRMRVSGSAGGHNGLQDIIDRLGSDAWCRLRLGLGGASGDMANYVLDRFGKGEEPLVHAICDRAADAVECWMEHGPDLTMTRFNGDVSLASSDD